MSQPEVVIQIMNKLVAPFTLRRREKSKPTRPRSIIAILVQQTPGRSRTDCKCGVVCAGYYKSSGFYYLCSSSAARNSSPQEYVDQDIEQNPGLTLLLIAEFSI